MYKSYTMQPHMFISQPLCLTNQRHCPLTSDHTFIQTFGSGPRPCLPGQKPGLALAERSWCHGGAKCWVPPVVALLNPGALRWIGWRLWEATASNVSDILPASAERRTLAEEKNMFLPYHPELAMFQCGYGPDINVLYHISTRLPRHKGWIFVQNLETNSALPHRSRT